MSDSMIFYSSKLHIFFHFKAEKTLKIRLKRSRYWFSCSSGSWAEGVIMSDGYILPDMSEEIIRDIFWVNVLDTDVHIQTCLNVVNWNVWFLEIVCSSSHAVGNCFISWRYPTSLDLCHFFCVSGFFLEFSSHVSNRLDSFLGRWVEISCRNVRRIYGWNCSDSSVIIVLEALFVGTGVISKLFMLRMLNQCWGKIGPVIVNISLTIEFLNSLFIQKMIFFLV